MHSNHPSIDQLKHLLNDTSFNSLMKNRIYQVLLISSRYDAFIMEDDGRIDEQIFNEYVSLNLRYPPQFILASSKEKALSILRSEKIDLIISMLNPEDSDTFTFAEGIKLQYPTIPIVVLTPFSRDVSLKIAGKDLSSIDYVFSWLGDSSILLAIIKLIEDKMNVEHDVEEIGVQVIILVEDSIRFYSSYLPNIYRIIFQQSKAFMTEGLNEHQKMLRMRGRPKILLATNYEEAESLYWKYKENLLGVISDISYKRDGKRDTEAGIKLARMVKIDNKYMPFLLQSSDAHFESRAKQLKVGFIHKHSKTLSIELRAFIKNYFAFGDFVFNDPHTGHEINRAQDLQALQQKIFEVPDASLEYHFARNHMSKWLNARALFPLAKVFKAIPLSSFENTDDARRFMFDAIGSFRMNKARGVIAQFYRDRYDEYLLFSRIGEGSLGGKARGLAFLDSMIKRNPELNNIPGVQISIPRTVVISTDVFDEFMEENNLYDFALSDHEDEEVLNRFVKARMPFRIHEDLYTFITHIQGPIAVRSSSLLEDSHYQPFAGIYSTYMVPNTPGDERRMMEQLSNAIKSVYASAFFHDSKAYMTATRNVIDEEKMGIVLQEVCGSQYDDYFYPSFSGVARSINFYPIPPEKAEDGIANIALGLGKHIVDGGVTLRFSPKFPKKILQLSEPDFALKETQKDFYALSLQKDRYHPDVDECVNLEKLDIATAQKHKSLKFIASTFDMQSGTIKEGSFVEGKKIITFNHILKHNVFPLADILQRILRIGAEEMNNPIEIEFAVNLNVPKGQPKIFSMLQIRPIVNTTKGVSADVQSVKEEDTLIASKSALGNGIITSLYDFVYIKPEVFDAARNVDVVPFVDKLNARFLEENKNYVLVGPGRWGSSDPWLGIPVKWPQISAARVIVESGLENYRIDPSQGTHFFQNLTSFGVGYFTINPFIQDGFYDLDFLNAQEAVYEDEYLRHVRFDEPIIVKIDGAKSLGVVLKPGKK